MRRLNEVAPSFRASRLIGLLGMVFISHAKTRSYEMCEIIDDLKLMADIWDDNEDQEMSVFFVRCIGEIRKLREALRPFAEHPEFQAPDEWAVTVIDRNGPTGGPVAGVTAGDFRRASKAMTPNV